MISFRHCTQLYANVKALQVRLQHSPDLEVNAKIVSLLPFQLLLYMIVFKYCSYAASSLFQASRWWWKSLSVLARLIFALLVLIRSHYTESLAQAMLPHIV